MAAGSVQRRKKVLIPHSATVSSIDASSWIYSTQCVTILFTYRENTDSRSLLPRDGNGSDMFAGSDSHAMSQRHDVPAKGCTLTMETTVVFDITGTQYVQEGIARLQNH